MKQQLKSSLPMHSFMLQFHMIYIAFNFKTHRVLLFVQREFHLDETGFLNFMLCYRIILHGMLINMHETPMKLPPGMALVSSKALQRIYSSLGMIGTTTYSRYAQEIGIYFGLRTNCNNKRPGIHIHESRGVELIPISYCTYYKSTLLQLVTFSIWINSDFLQYIL